MIEWYMPRDRDVFEITYLKEWMGLYVSDLRYFDSYAVTKIPREEYL